ncbi:arginine--tRNA ligase, cytoplasmic isoform X1 [Schistocerca cancellata]|uniref:arginine--tRNA ligase, cytoplasmic isoform X1 n=2 Tax=Schistocerca cancellata TaxID=274614 RepID=UPI0021182E2A|nr:arginine--tRNA ligase, cytoplasmic isoform X1 [Schistocerca cancellata]
MDESTLLSYKTRAEQAEAAIVALTKELENIKGGKCVSELSKTNPEIKKLADANNALKYRIRILQRSIKEEEEKNKQQGKTMDGKEMDVDSSSMRSVLGELTMLFSRAIEASFPDLADPPVNVSLSPKFADYQCNSALPVLQLLKAQGVKMSPVDIAKKIVDNVPKNDLIKEMSVAGAGFINISLCPEFGQKALTDLLKNGVKPPPIEKKLRVVVDFSAPNIAKEMHVGHLRSTIIGESICRLLEFLGHDVLRINHIGDWGTQFGMLIAHLQEKFPDYQTNVPPISDLQAFYKESKVRFDNDQDFKKKAYECVVKLQKFHPEVTSAWELICSVSRKEFQKVYDRLEIKLEERGESFYQSRMEAVVKELDEKGFLEEDEGRKIMWGLDKDAIPLTVVKSDGGFTYDTSDIACIKQRIEEEKVDWIIYVTDAGQAGHFKVLFSCAKRVGILKPNVRVDHVGFGLVLGEDKKKFKTRSGETVRLVELLDEGLRRSLEKLKEKQRDQVLTQEELVQAQEAVAYGCIKYADLSHNRNHDYVFSFDKMLEDRGNTAVYLLYALTRIRSIARTAGLESSKVREAVGTVPVSITHEREWKLAKVLLRLPETLEKITKDLCLHHLCEYLYEVSCTFTDFYDACYCVEKDSTGEIKAINMGRLLLCEAVALVMEKCFYLLGIKTVSRM